MVHALEIVHSLLVEGGLLVDIHPSGEPPPIEIVHGGERFLAGCVQEGDDFVEYFQTDEALAESVAMGLFELERQGMFDFINRANSLADLLDYLETNWSDAIVAPEVRQEAARLLAEASSGEGTQPARLVMTERVRILRLKSNDRSAAAEEQRPLCSG